jgi:dienelactone hydrolase
VATISYRDGETALTGELILSAGAPGVLVVHGGAGLDEHARECARQIAGWGYTVLACDMYGDPPSIRALLDQLMADPDLMCRRAGTGLDVLSAQPGVDGRVAAVGYCFGGTVALTLARSGVALAAAASVHGGLRTSRPAGSGQVRARILVSHGGADPHVPPADVAAFTTEMLAAGADWQLHVHPGAQHGFTHRQLAGVPSPIPGVAYDEAADHRSFAVLRAFLADTFSS